MLLDCQMLEKLFYEIQPRANFYYCPRSGVGILRAVLKNFWDLWATPNKQTMHYNNILTSNLDAESTRSTPRAEQKA